jgi:hypothetical protein
MPSIFEMEGVLLYAILLFNFAAVYQLENMLLSIVVNSGDGLNFDLDVEVSLLYILLVIYLICDVRVFIRNRD